MKWFSGILKKALIHSGICLLIAIALTGVMYVFGTPELLKPWLEANVEEKCGSSDVIVAELKTKGYKVLKWHYDHDDTTVYSTWIKADARTVYAKDVYNIVTKQHDFACTSAEPFKAGRKA